MKQSFPPTHWERFGPGTIYARANTGFNRSHPVNRSQPGTGKPGTICAAWWVIDRDGGDGGVGQSSDALMIRDPIDRPRRKGSFLAIFQYGGRERAIPPATGRETGLPPEVTGYQPPTLQISATGANRKPCKPCFLVGRWRTPALARPVGRIGAEGPVPRVAIECPGKTVGVAQSRRENGQRRKSNADAGLQAICRQIEGNRPVRPSAGLSPLEKSRATRGYASSQAKNQQNVASCQRPEW